jgi:uncharacterized protein with HEPN domain
MNPHDRVRLRHIADALNAAMRFVEGRKRSDLETDDMLLFALVRAIEIVGEAASKVTAETRRDTGFAVGVDRRHANRLVHAYFDINRDILWTTVTEAVPALAEHLKTSLDRE